jgi:glucan phosphoethanolaminetransferase (alkaline phosphatase superfamily)
MYADLMIMGIAGNHFGHSLLNGLRIAVGDESFPAMQRIMLPYLAFSTFIFSMVSLFIIFVERVFWKRITILVICMCLLPYTSTDYKLLHFFIPLFLFVNHSKTSEEESEPFDIYYILLFSMLLIPKSYYYFHDSPLYTLNNVLNPIIMIALLSLIVWSKSQQVRAVFRFQKKVDLRQHDAVTE